MAGGARRAKVRPGKLRSGRAVRVVRRGGGLVVRWKRGPEPVRRYRVGIEPRRGKAIRLTAHARRPRVRLARAPAGPVRVFVTAVRLGPGRDMTVSKTVHGS